MKVPDANLLLYSVNQASPHHEPAISWLEGVLSSSEPVGFTWGVVLAFIRLSTRALIFPQPLRIEEAFDFVEGWLAQPNALLLEPTRRHLAILRELLGSAGTAGNLTADAHLAALAIEYGGEVYSADADFSRFHNLHWRNPLR